MAEGDPGIENVTVEGNFFDKIGSPPVEVNEGVPPGRGIVVKDNRVIDAPAVKTDDDRFDGDQAALSPPDNHFWRNDSANLAVTAKWNQYLDATPFSWDITSPNISDAPPIGLSWSMGADSPMPMKDGHGCLFKERYFVISGGEWCYPVSLSNTTQPDPPCIPDTKTFMYDILTHRWSELAPVSAPTAPLHSFPVSHCLTVPKFVALSVKCSTSRPTRCFGPPVPVGKTRST